ncbi:hypothetical protein SSX86_027672 [Deinandra increscens subsp. villosa]|uniref:PGG domain-containing protein n=1 Tax=Deinandra increscens subsp. villosa TaxID=3103831 RepID=A0AAP0CBK3_9ASTR
MCDWEMANIIFNKRPDLVRFSLSENLGTALHVAVNAKWSKKNVNFVKNLVDIMTVDDLELKNKHSNTAFWEAAAFGDKEVLKILMARNHNLLNIRGSDDGLFPLTASISKRNAKSARYLYSISEKMSDKHWTNRDKDLTLLYCVKSRLFALRLCCMEVQPLQYGGALKLLKIIWGHATRTMDIGEIEDMLRRPSKLLFIATERGITEFVVELLRTYPHLMLDKNDDGLTIFHVAIMHRRLGIYNLLYEVGGSSRSKIVELKDKSDNQMCHLIGKTSKDMAARMSRASLLLQREVLWFNNVGNMVSPYMWEEKNKDGQTALELFLEQTEDQVSKGLIWTKDCMVVATLIITVAFAVAFTVPGGYKGDNGLPFFIHQRALLVFAIADAMSLFSSTTSLLVFLSILTSPRDQHDFVYLLPRKLMIGILTLFISVAAMMVTFSASFFMLYHKGLKWVPILITALATVPVIVYAILQFPLFMDMFRTMYDSHYLFNPKKGMLYNTKAEVNL